MIYKDHFALFIKIINLKEEKIEIEHSTLFLGKNFVISYEENEKEVFNLIKKRIELVEGRVRNLKADNLLFALIDVINDNYSLIFERNGITSDNSSI